jgi:xanthine dehydrogenase accessory factor
MTHGLMSHAGRVAELAASQVPCVHAVVVRAQLPAPVRPGDDAVILADGTIEGFVGGECAESSVRSAALGALESGRTVLLRVVPPEGPGFPETPGARVVVNPCLSGGALEIFLRPLLPPPVLWISGTSPIAAALSSLAASLDFAVRTDGAPSAVVIASHGHDEEPALRSALASDAVYIGLVASKRRGAALLDGMGLSAEESARVRSPAGLWIGARTPAEIALSILAEIIATLRLREPPAPAPVEAVDPVCGMTVLVGAATPHLVVDGVDHWFCGEGCRERYA